MPSAFDPTNPTAMIDLLQRLWPLLTGLCSIIAVLALVWLNRYFVTWKSYDKRQLEIDQILDGHDKRLAWHSERINAVEGHVSDISTVLARLPQREDMLNLELGLSEVRGGLREVNASMQGLRDVVERQEGQVSMVTEHLLNKA